MRIQANPDAELKSFPPVKAGVYPMTIVEVTEPEVSQYDGMSVRWTLRHVTPFGQLTGLDGNTLKSDPESVAFFSSIEFDKQGKLRALAEGSGLTWPIEDTQQLIGRQVKVLVSEKMSDKDKLVHNRASRVVIEK